MFDIIWLMKGQGFGMEIEIDIDRLRRDLMDYYGTAMSGGFPMAVIDLSRVQNASPEDLVSMALNANVDLLQYEV